MIKEEELRNFKLNNSMQLININKMLMKLEVSLEIFYKKISIKFSAGSLIFLVMIFGYVGGSIMSVPIVIKRITITKGIQYIIERLHINMKPLFATKQKI